MILCLLISNLLFAIMQWTMQKCYLFPLQKKLRFCGHSNWKMEQIVVYISDETADCPDPDKQAMLRRGVVEHLCALVGYVFMHCKPARPSQSRWTGIAHVSQWTLGLALFHRFLSPLFAALSAKSDAATCKDSDNAGSTIDTDARVQVVDLIAGCYESISQGSTSSQVMNHELRSHRVIESYRLHKSEGC